MKLWTILGETVLLFFCYYFCNFASYETLHNNMVLKSSNCYCGSTWEGKYSILKYFKLNFPIHLKSDNILSFLTALQIQYRYSSRNLAHGSWNFWYLIEVQTILEKCVVFFSLKRS